MQKYQNRCHFREENKLQERMQIDKCHYSFLDQSLVSLNCPTSFFLKGGCHSDITEPAKLSQLFIIRE